MKFEPYGNLVDQAFLQFNVNLINNQDPHSRIENDETPGAEHPNESDSEEGKTNKTSALPNFVPQILSDDKIAEGINSLNSKQREIFNEIHTWLKEYVKYDGRNVEPIQSGGTSKSHLVNVIYDVIPKTLLYHCKDPGKLRVLLLGPTRISAINIGRTTIHSGLGIKPEIKLLGLNSKSNAALRNRLSEVKFLIIDELCMVSTDLCTNIDSRLGEIFVMIPKKAFAGLPVMTVADLLQLPPIRGKLIFSVF